MSTDNAEDEAIDLPAIEARHSVKLSANSEHAKSPTKNFSEWSHQHAIESPILGQQPHDQKEGDDHDDLGEGQWQDMPAIAEHDIYDDESGKIVAHAHALTQDNVASKAKGYSRVQGDDDARSVDSVDEQTNHLFNASGDNTGLDDEATVTSQLSHTKDLLTEGQRIAYIGICKLVLVSMLKEMTMFNSSKESRGEGRYALEGLILWSQKITVRLYQHIEITPAEQLMMEQLSEHKIEAKDLAPALSVSSRVTNPVHSKEVSSVPPAYDQSVETDVSSTSRPPEKVEITRQPEASSCEAPSKITNAQALENEDKLDLDIRWTVLFDLFLLLISDSHYDARSRVLLVEVAKVLGVSYLELTKFEKKVTDALEVQDQEDAQVSVDQENGLTSTRDKSSRNRRYMLMGLATIGGGLVIGLSAGLLAPVIGAGLGAGFASIGVSGATSFLAGTTGAALITTSGVVTGSTIATRSAAKRVSSVKTFEFKPLFDNKRVNLLVTIPGWLAGSEDDVRLPFSTIDPIMGDICSVLWEPELLRTFQATGNILATEVLTQSLQQVLGQTVLTALMSALQWPLVLTKLSYLIDNPWSNSLDRAKAAGLILADALVSRSLGVRPISLVGYSLGARVIYFALLELARIQAYGIVENVYMFGAPIVVTAKEWRKAKSVVAGRFLNGYVKNDWILGYLFRATSGGIGRVAGLRPVEGIDTVENMDCTDDVDGHMSYRQAMPRLMRKAGYEITSEEFQEIDDPDPDKTRERARELLDDIEEARRQETIQKKKKRSFFSFGKPKNLVTPENLPTGLATASQYDTRAPYDEKTPSPSVSEVRPTTPGKEAQFDVAKILHEAHQSTPIYSRDASSTNAASLRTQSMEEISMTFGSDLSEDLKVPSRPHTPRSIGMSRLSTSHSVRDEDPSGYVPRPSLQHANTMSGALESLVLTRPRDSTSSYLTTNTTSTTNLSRQSIECKETAITASPSVRPQTVVSGRSDAPYEEEDFAEEGEITMSFG